jgi:ornithine carbamoyltransferase
VAISLMIGCARLAPLCELHAARVVDDRCWAKSVEVAARNGVTVEIVNDPKRGVAGANVLYSDVWSRWRGSKKESRLRLLRPYLVNMECQATGNARRIDFPSCCRPFTITKLRDAESGLEVPTRSSSTLFQVFERPKTMHTSRRVRVGHGRSVRAVTAGSAGVICRKDCEHRWVTLAFAARGENPFF